MFRKVFAFVCLLVIFSLTLNTSASAQQGQAPASPTANQAPDVALGQPGLSYRYVDMFGTTEVPYFVDTEHINRPVGLFMDRSDDSLYVTEQNGSRVLKYAADKTNLLAIGTAGVHYTDDYVFSDSWDSALDPDGNIWVVDQQRLVEYSQAGIFMRNYPATEPWSSGSDHGRFENAKGLAFDGLGHLFVADSDNQRVEIFSWTSGNDPVYLTSIGVTDEPGDELDHLNQPYRVEAKADGTLFILDYGNNRALACPFDDIGISWSCSLLISGLNNPRGLALDSSGQVFISDSDSGRVVRCNGTTCQQIIADTWMFDLAIDSSGNIYGAQPWDCRILKFNSAGNLVETFLGVTNTCYQTDSAHFNQPRVAIDSEDNMLVLEEAGHRMLKFSPNGALLWSFGQAGHDVNDNAHLNWPHGLDTDPSGNIYVADNYRVQIFNENGIYQSTIGTVTSDDPARFFGWLTDVAVDPNDGTIYVSDSSNHVVWVYNSSHNLVGQIGTTGQCIIGNLGLCYPAGLDVDQQGNVYISDVGNNTVQKYNSQLQYQISFGTPGPSGNQHGQFIYPETVSVDPQGRVFVDDWGNNRVEVFDAAGAYLATIGGVWGDNPGQFRGASDVSFDSHGNAYVSDHTNVRIQKFAPGYPGWRQANVNGFGDIHNVEPMRLSVHNNYLYAGTQNTATGAEVWRTADSSEWNQVNVDGFGNPSNTHAFVESSINGYLYVGTQNGTTGAELWRCALCNGSDWSKVADGGFGDSNNSEIQRVMTVNGILFATVDNSATGVEVWKSTTGNLGTWTQTNVDGFGSILNKGLWSAAVLNGYIYVAASQTDETSWVPGGFFGTDVWRTTNGSVWEQVNPAGFPGSGSIAWDLSAAQNQLYLSTANFDGAEIRRCSVCNGSDWELMTVPFGQRAFATSIYDFNGIIYAATINNWTLGRLGMEVWRSADGTHWTKAASDGLGNVDNTDSDAAMMISFKGNMYMGVTNSTNGAGVWRLLNQVYLPTVRR